MKNIDDYVAIKDNEENPNCIFISDYYGDPKEIIIPEELNGYPITKILERAFAKCKTLEKITLPQSLEIIEKGAFENCSNLQEIVLPPQIKVIESSTFANCTSLRKVIFSKKLEKIYENAFFKCKNLTEIIWNKNIKIIDQMSFAYCENIVKLQIPTSVSLIANKSFYRCTNLEFVEFSNPNVMFDILIETNAISYNEKMRNIPEKVVKSFSKSEKERYLLKQLSTWNELSLFEKEIFSNAWNNNDKYFIDLVFLKSTTTEISIYFKEGFHLDLVLLDNYLELYIEQKNTTTTAILLEYKNNNFSQEKIDIHESEKELVEMGFQLPSLEQFQKKWEIKEYSDYITILGYKGKNKFEVIPESIDTGKPILYVAYNIISAFADCNNATNGNNPLLYTNFTQQTPDEFAPLERVSLPNGDEILLTQNFRKSNIKEISFPPNIRIVTYGILYNFEHIEKVVLPDYIEIILRDAFSFCKSLKEINLPLELTTIKEAGFHHCESLENIVFPDKLKSISSYAFQDCHSLVEITLPKSLKKLNSQTFFKCKNLKRVNLPDTLKDIDNDTFCECPALEFVGYSNGENILETLKDT